MANSQWADSASRVPIVFLNTDDRTILEYSFAKTVGRQTPFSVETVRQHLKTSGFDRPAITGAVDWDEVEIRRQIYNLLANDQMSIALLPKPEDQALVEALDKYRNHDYAGALERWPNEHRQPKSSVLRLLLARLYAELGRAECLDLIATTEELHPIDSVAVRAIYESKTGNKAGALKSYERFVTLLVKDPWVIPSISDDVIAQCADDAVKDPEIAKRLYPMLAKPFASNRYDYWRRAARILLGAQLGPAEAVAALADFEPNVPWTAQMLKIRRDAYAATSHPLAAKAQRELDLFERNRPAK